MQFMLSLIAEEPDFDQVSPEEMQAEIDRMMAYNRELEGAGAFYLGGGLQERANSKTVRFDADGKTAVSDGTHSDASEQLAGFWIIECETLDEALEWARKAPVTDGVIEVRPFAHELEGKPSEGAIGAEELLEGVKGSRPKTS